MRVYIAAPYAARSQCRAIAVVLASHGHEVTSTWLEETHEISPGTLGAAAAVGDEAIALHAHADIEDIERSDALVLLTGEAAECDPAVAHTGGRHVETGYAIARHKLVVVVGEPENVFHRAPALVTRVGSVAEAMAVLEHTHGEVPC